ncbi:type II secretion system protein GspG [bacterium]|nr:type II secretion system protein GspG [bacterium]
MRITCSQPRRRQFERVGRALLPDKPGQATRPIRAGFTLVELLLVLLILAVLAAIVVPKFVGRSEQARITAAQTQLAMFESQLDAFEVDNGYYPKGSDGLLQLVEEPRDAKNWRGPY